MAKGTLSRDSLDVLNRAIKIKSDIDFCGEDGGLQKDMKHFMTWLGGHLRSELQRNDWEDSGVLSEEEGLSLYLYSPTWRLPSHHDHVMFFFWWPALFGEPPAVALYLPAQEVFHNRNELLGQLRPPLIRRGFTPYYEHGDPPSSVPIWKNIQLEDFHREAGFDLDSFVGAVVDAFRCLTESDQLIDDAIRSEPQESLVLPSDRRLKTIAFVDTECTGSGIARRMTQLAIINVAYDPDADAVVGILEEYCMNADQTLNEVKARSVLERTEFIVAHNAFSADKPLLARHLPGSEKLKWLCSFRGIDWKSLLGVQGQSLKTLMGKAGLRYEQDHRALEDARDLRRLLAVKCQGRTYLGRLLDSSQSEA